MSFFKKPKALVDERIQNESFWPYLSVARSQKVVSLVDGIRDGNADSRTANRPSRSWS